MTKLITTTTSTGIIPVNAAVQNLVPALKTAIETKALQIEVGGEKVVNCTTNEMRALAAKTRQISHTPSIIPNLLKSYTLKRVKSEANSELWDNLIGALGSAVAQIGKFYFRASLPTDEKEAMELILGIAEIIGANFLQLSVEEITHAFEWALVKNPTKYQAYGGLSVQLVTQILTDYRTSRNKYLSALQDAENAVLQEQERAQKIPELNEKAYIDAVKQIQALSLENTAYSCWSACPDFFVERMVKEGIIIVPMEDKKRMHEQAKNLAAAYVFKGLRGVVHRNNAAAFFGGQGLGFLQFYDRLPEVYKQKNSPDSGANFEQAHAQTTKLFYSKMLYKFCLAPYKNKRENDIQKHVQTLLQNHGKEEQ